MEVPIYDIIIIGGGIAGLYQAYQHLKKDPNKKILLLEAANRLGGRIYTYHDNTIYKSGIEAGAGRFHKGHRKLMNLLKELDLDHLIIPISTNKQYIPTPNTPPPKTPPSEYINNVLRTSKTTPTKDLQNQTFLEYARKVLPSDYPSPPQTILDSFGYSTELTDMNAYDTINLIKTHYNNKNYYVLKGGMEQIITHLISKLETYPNFEYNLREPAIDIQPYPINKTTNTKIIKIITPKTTYTATKCICALIKEDLEKIPIFLPIKSNLQKIKNFPLCRIYCKFPKDSKTNQPWFHDLSKMTTNNNLRYIIPINPDQGTIMISYTDNKYADYWNHIKTTKGIQALNRELQTQLCEIFPHKKIPIPTHTKMFYWRHGVAYFLPKFDSTKDLDKIHHPFPNLPIQICGENYSTKNAQWIEGALE